MDVKKEIEVKQFQVVPQGEGYESIYVVDQANKLWWTEDNGSTWKRVKLPEVAL